MGAGWRDWEKREKGEKTHGHRQQGGDCRRLGVGGGGRGYGGINGDGKKLNKIKTKKKEKKTRTSLPKELY